MRLIIAAAALCALVGACNKKSSSSDGAGKPDAQTKGCIQGVVVDGLTGQRAALHAAPNLGVFVLARNELLPATLAVPNPDDAGANPNLVGEYQLCNIPLDEKYPIFVWADGYLPYESIVEVSSTAAARSPNALEDIERKDPSELVNVRIWPKNQQVKDLAVDVYYDGAPLANATVTLRAVGTNFLDPEGSLFLPPLNVRSPTLKGTTDAAGHVAFPAAELVLGGHYTYTVIPPEGGANQTAVASEAFVLGLRKDTDKTEPYHLLVNLKPGVTELVELSRSTDANDPDPTGKLVVYFNREIELVPGTVDGAHATLSGNVKAELVEETLDNDAPETVKITIDANRMTLEPVYKTNPDSDITKELGLTVSYSGIQVRPKASPHTLKSVTVSGDVRYYR